MNQSDKEELQEAYEHDLRIIQSFCEKYPPEVIPPLPLIIGFLTGIGCHPDWIHVEEFFDILVPPEYSNLLSEDDTEDLMYTLAGFGDHLGLRVMNKDLDSILSYYRGVGVEDAFDEQNDFHQWISGWCRSIYWLAESFREILDSLKDLPDLVQEYRSAQTVIMYFDSRESADLLYQELAKENESPKSGQELDKDFFGLIPWAVEVMVTCYDLFQPMTSAEAGETIGRNDPCPCGSGKKYKKCCLGKNPTFGETPEFEL